MSRLEWMDAALCRQVDPNLFTPQNYIESQQAREICNSCPVKIPCLEYALENNEEGIWGGTTHRQRREMRGAAYRQRAS